MAVEAPEVQSPPTPYPSVVGLAASTVSPTAPSGKPTLTPLRAIRAACLDCCAGQRTEVRECHLEDCPLWPYRMGRNPQRAGIGGKPRLSASFQTSKAVGAP